MYVLILLSCNKYLLSKSRIWNIYTCIYEIILWLFLVKGYRYFKNLQIKNGKCNGIEHSKHIKWQFTLFINHDFKKA